MTEQASDTDLLARVQDGDEAALLALHDRYAGAVYAVAYRVLGDRMTAEEVAQDTFLRLWQKGHTYDPARGDFLPWLLTISKRRAIDMLRQRERRFSVRQDAFSLDEQPYLAETIPGTGPDRAQRELRQALVMALQDLPEAQAQVITLAYFYGMTHRDIAAHLDLPLGTIKTRLRLGMQKLRQSWLEASNLKSSDES